MFPGVQLNASKHLYYFPFKLCNSFPQRNMRGRMFLPQVLSNSFASLTDQLIDVDHMLDDNGTLSSGTERIVGFVKATNFLLPENYNFVPGAKVSAELNNIKPIPVYALGTLFSRARGVRQAVEKHLKGEESWKVSMECGHKWHDAYFYHRGEFIPISDAEIGMKDCVQPDSVKQFKGEELSVCLGGLNGRVDFWGCAVTRTPADPDAHILNFFAGTSPELASKKIFHLPFYSLNDSEFKEVANKSKDETEAVDKAIKEISNVQVLGQTESTSDGHSHFVLSNGIIVPENGHTHFVSQFLISRGTNPTYTGVTDTHHSRVKATGECACCGSSCVADCQCVEFQHLHLINIPLKGKFKPDGSVETEQIDSLLSSGNSESEDEAMAKASATVNELLAKIDGAVERLVKATTDTDKKGIEAEIASTRKEIAAITSQQETEESRQQWLNSLVEKGEYVSKEKADAAVVAATTTAKEDEKKKYDQQLKDQQIRNDRLQKLTALNFDLEQQFQGVTDKDGKPVTIKSRIDMIPTDDAGETQFKIEYQLLESLAKQSEQQAAAEQTAQAAGQNTGTSAAGAGTPAPQQGAAGTDAANAVKTGAQQPPKRKVLAVASAGTGAGSGTTAEAANSGANGGGNGKQLGKHRFSKLS